MRYGRLGLRRYVRLRTMISFQGVLRTEASPGEEKLFKRLSWTRNARALPLIKRVKLPPPHGDSAPVVSSLATASYSHRGPSLPCST